MMALVLNTSAESERMSFQKRQLAELGIPFERVEAVTPATLYPPSTDRYWKLWERPLRVTEMATLGTHQAAWRRIADAPGPILVLEDDALLMPGIADFLAVAAGLTCIEHISLEVRGREKLLGRRRHPSAPIFRLWQDRSGAAAYILWPSGARKLLAHSAIRPGLADAVICAAYDLGSWQADPALAIQIDMCERYGVPPPIRTDSKISNSPKPDGRSLGVRLRAGYACRRAAAQLRMGVRYLLCVPFGVRRLVNVAEQEQLSR